jgi:hypothetical protein
VRLTPKYSGGYWRFLELGNGGFYMAPQARGRFEIRMEGNGFEGEMSADAAGITACLFVFSHLSFQVPDESIARTVTSCANSRSTIRRREGFSQRSTKRSGIDGGFGCKLTRTRIIDARRGVGSVSGVPPGLDTSPRGGSGIRLVRIAARRGGA